MYVEACTRLELPFEEARGRLLSVRPETGRRMVAPVAGLPIGKEVEVDLDRPVEGDGVVCLSLRWRPTWPAGAFPSFDGELELARLADGSAELWLLGRYEPPLGAVGRVLDRAVLHVVANDAMRQVLESMASRLEHPAEAA